MTIRTKTFFEENKTIEIEELASSLISMTVTLYEQNGTLTYTRFYDTYAITFEDVFNHYKRLGV